jgi:uncharacterized SAM-binding protein YcdF (DUF218 family)
VFYLSKIVWAFLQPSSLIAIVLLAGLFLAIRGKRAGLPVLCLGVALYLICGFSSLGNWLLIPLEKRAEIGASAPIEGAAGIIVLGGAVSEVRDSGDKRVVLNDSADRMIEAVRLARQYPDLPVIFSGGRSDLFASGSETPEAELARRFFEEFTIAPPRLRLESRSRNTFENAVFTAELMQPQSDQRWVLVTSAFHMPRARALFEAQGFRIIPRPGDFRTSGPESLWEIFGKPSEGLRRVDVAAKEWVGLWMSWLRGDISWPNWREESFPIRSARQAETASPSLPLLPTQFP